MILSIFGHLKDSIHKQLFKKGVVVLAYRFSGLVLGFLFTILVGKKYGSELLGIIALILSLINIFSLVSKVGLDLAFLNFATQFIRKGKKREVSNLFWRISSLILIFGIGTSVFLWLFAPFIGELLFTNPDKNLFVKLSILFVLPNSLLLLLSEGFRSIKKMGAYAFFNTASPPLIACILFVFLESIYSNYLSIILFRLIPLIFLIFFAFILLIPHLKLLQFSNKKIVSVNFKDLLKYGASISISNAVGMIMQHSGIILLGFYSTEAEVGIYKIVISFSLLTNLMLVAISNISAPLYSEAFHDNDIQKIKELSKKSVQIIFWTTLPVLLVFMVFPKYILSSVGISFETGWRALMILTLSQFFNAISGSVGVILNMTNKQKIRTNTALVSGVINIILSFILVPIYGINGAALAFAISSCLWNISGVFYIKKYFHFNTIYLPFLNR